MRKGLPGGHPFNTYISWGLDVVFVLHRHVVRDGFQASASTAHSPLVAVAGGGSWVTSRRNHSVGVERMEELGFHSRIETTRMHQAAECMCAESKPLPRDGRQAPGKLSRCSHHDLCSRLDIYFPLCRLWPPSTGPHPEAACPLQESVDGQSWRWEESGKRPKPMGKPIPGRPGVVKDAASTIYAKNLPYAATEADLEAFFSRVGDGASPASFPSRVCIADSMGNVLSFARLGRSLTLGGPATIRGDRQARAASCLRTC